MSHRKKLYSLALKHWGWWFDRWVYSDSEFDEAVMNFYLKRAERYSL